MGRIHLAEVEIRHFRNLSTLSLHPHPRFNIVSGPNGMGKTNLLEAVYLLGALRSFRTAAREEMISLGRGDASVSGIFAGDAAGLLCEVQLNARGRRVRVDGKAVTASGEHYRNLPMVLFHPATMELVQSGPDARRRFLDRALYQAEPVYPGFHRDYNRALGSRNRVLKQQPVDTRALAAFDPQLADLGASICQLRADFIATLAPVFAAAFRDMSKGLSATITYSPKASGDREDLIAALRERLPLDSARGYTSIGPHADELQIDLDGRPARKFASQGQQRMIALALKIAETNVIERATGRIPILLLDDISSELDRARNRRLFEFLLGVGGQVFITTTHLDHILIDEERRDYQLMDGRLCQ